MESIRRQEFEHLKRYLIVRGVSRVGDVVIYSMMLGVGGVKLLMPAFLISSGFNYLSDYFGQKFYTFRNKLTLSWALAKEFGRYMLVRVTNIALAFIVYYNLHVIYGVSLPVTILIVGIIFLSIVFLFYRKIFLGSNEDLKREMEVFKKELPTIIKNNILETIYYTALFLAIPYFLVMIVLFANNMALNEKHCYRNVCIEKHRRI